MYKLYNNNYRQVKMEVNGKGAFAWQMPFQWNIDLD